MFNIGDFVIKDRSGELLVAVTPTIGRVLCRRPQAIFITNTIETHLFSLNDRLATKADLTPFEKPHGWPKWVGEAKAGLQTPVPKVPHLPVGAIPLTPQGLVDHKPRPAPKPDPHAGRPTIQMFQNTCAHKFQVYTGFSRVYEYCIFCDVKKDI